LRSMRSTSWIWYRTVSTSSNCRRMAGPSCTLRTRLCAIMRSRMASRQFAYALRVRMSVGVIARSAWDSFGCIPSSLFGPARERMAQQAAEDPARVGPATGCGADRDERRSPGFEQLDRLPQALGVRDGDAPGPADARLRQPEPEASSVNQQAARVGLEPLDHPVPGRLSMAPADVEAHRQTMGDEPRQRIANAVRQPCREADGRVPQGLQRLQPVAAAKRIEPVGIAQRAPARAKGDIVRAARDQAQRRAGTIGLVPPFRQARIG